MLSQRRPAKLRQKCPRVSSPRLNFVHLRKEVVLMSKIGFIIRDSEFYRERVQPEPQEREAV